MSKYKRPSKGEELLTQILDDCLEEELNFIPTEREIAREHRFSPEFTSAMDQLLEEAAKEQKDLEVKRHFRPRYVHMAACILVLCVCGWLFYSIIGPLSEKNSDSADTSAALTEESAQTEAEVEEAETEESEAEESVETTEDSGSDEEQSDQSAEVPSKEELKSRSWKGMILEPAAEQVVPELQEDVTTLVNCPVLDEDIPSIYLTIGNVGEDTVHYLDSYDLEVWIEDGWYVISAADYENGSWQELESGMAMDVEIDLTEYPIDYSAEKYRLIVHTETEAISAEFTFAEVFKEKMEKLEEEESSGE